MELYGQLTSSLNDLFTEQLTESVQWRVVPGQLNRISSSPSGYTWGVNLTNDIFVRKENDQWVKHERPTQGSVLDLTTDSERVYILDQDGVRSKSVSGDGSWSAPVKVPEGTRTIVATASQLVADTSRGVFMCRAPCSSPSWVSTDSVQATLSGTETTHPLAGGPGGFLQGTKQDSSATISGSLQSLLEGSTASHVLTAIFPQRKNVTITSASARYVYGVDGNGKAHVYKNGEWQPIPGLVSKSLSSVSGEVDESALYAVETTGQVLRCSAPCQSDGDIEAIGTNGRSPDTSKLKQFTIDGARHKLWSLSSVGGGSYGNSISVRNETFPDFSKDTGPLDAQRDLEVEQIQQKYAQARSGTMAGKDIQSATDFLAKLDTRVPPSEDERLLRRSVDIGSGTIQQSLFVLQVACAVVFVVFLVYMALPAPWSHALAFVVACIGTAISFSASKGNGKS